MHKNLNDKKHIQDFGLLLNMYGFTKHDDYNYTINGHDSSIQCSITASYNYSLTASTGMLYGRPKSIICSSLNQLVSYLDKITSSTSQILAGKSARELSKNLVRVKSSNVWAISINIKHHGDEKGDIIVQFKNEKGGPGDIYRLYGVPVRVYRQWVTAPSKGHFYWKYLRNNYLYSKLTGDKRGKLKNAVN